MTRHSKNATSRAFYSYDERSKLKGKYGTIEQRFGADSGKPFESCGICLKPCTAPMCWYQGQFYCESSKEGHLYCRECIFESMLSQKREIAASKDAIAHERRRLELELESRITEADAKSKAQMERDQTQAMGATSSSAPSVLPAPAFDVEQELRLVIKEKELKADAICPSSDHVLRLKDLAAVRSEMNADKKFVCPSCLKPIQYQKVILYRECGHILCHHCHQLITKTQETCFQCGLKLKASGTTSLQQGHTGFATHNDVMTKVYVPTLT